MDRVRELGDASVPFRYDVHAMFFFATPAEVRAVLLEKDGGLLEFHENPAAPEYFQSVGHWPDDLNPWRRSRGPGRWRAVLFGGPHTSGPSFRRATVQPGDLLYPIGVCDQVLYLLGRMRVTQVVPVGEDQALLEKYYARYPAWRFLAPTCTTEVVIGSGGTAVMLDRPVPGEILRRLTYRPRRGPRPVRHADSLSRPRKHHDTHAGTDPLF